MTTAWQFIRIGLFIADLILFGLSADAATWGPQVVVRTVGQRMEQTGSGGVIGQDGDSVWVLTNSHVVANDRPGIWFGAWTEGRVVCRGSAVDLALVRVVVPDGEEVRIAKVAAKSPTLPAVADRYTFSVPRFSPFSDRVSLSQCVTDRLGRKQCLASNWAISGITTSGQSGSPITMDGHLVAVVVAADGVVRPDGVVNGAGIVIRHQEIAAFLRTCREYGRPGAPPAQPPVTPSSPVDPNRIERIEGLLLQQGKAIELLLGREPQAGPPGERGPAGPQGPQGPPGQESDAQAVRSLRSEVERLQARVSALESATYRVIVHKPDGQYDSETYRVGDDVHLRLFQRQER